MPLKDVVEWLNMLRAKVLTPWEQGVLWGATKVGKDRSEVLRQLAAKYGLREALKQPEGEVLHESAQ